jgi:proprotein convertase subtilisin/kexin type 2
MLLGKRPKDDDSKSGFTKWPFMTTQTWAENPRGRWKLFVIYDSDEPQTGTLHEWTLLLHGTRVSPYVNQKVSVDQILSDIR